jgi:2-oxoisovalerate dehydrogenase E1 component
MVWRFHTFRKPVVEKLLMPTNTERIDKKVQVPDPEKERQHLLAAWRLMVTAARMSDLYEEKRDLTSRYVHSSSRGHEAIQIAAGLQLKPCDYLSPYYRDDALLLAIGLQPGELMLQLLAKDDPFSGGRSYYAHPSLRRPGFPTIPHQSSATGMQAIPATGMAQGITYLAAQNLLPDDEAPVVLCSLGDGSVTEGEVAEAFQMAVLHKLPIIYLVQDNGWGISATAPEMRAMDAYEYAGGFTGLERFRADGSDFSDSFACMKKVFELARAERRPMLVHATCPLLSHHTSGVRKEFYRDASSLQAHATMDPLEKFRKHLISSGVNNTVLDQIKSDASAFVNGEFQKAVDAPFPDQSTFNTHEFTPTTIVRESGTRSPKGAEKVMMVDAALHAIDELLALHPEALLYGQDVGSRLGGVFREAATLAKKHGEHRVFNTPIQEAYIIGSTAGMSAVGVRPIVEIQFADYIWPGINQLVEELSKSCYLTVGKFPIRSVIRVPTGAYGGGGPYHSGNVESALLTIAGIKVVYPSNAADMKGLMKAAFYDNNPVVMLEHKGLYWSKVPGTNEAKTPEPSSDYIIPLGLARIVMEATSEKTRAVVVTYGMGIYWALEASKKFPGQITVLDLRTLNPLDWNAITTLVKSHNRAMVLTEEPWINSFAESLAGRISKECFQQLDAPVFTVGAERLPAVPLNVELERRMLPSAEKVSKQLSALLEY